MAAEKDKVTFRISAAAAPYVGADKPREERLKAAAGQVPLSPGDLVLLVYYLCHDADPEVKRTAMDTLRLLEPPFLSRLLQDPQVHPRILDVLVKLHATKPGMAELFALHPMLSEQAAVYIARLSLSAETPAPPGASAEAAGENEGGEEPLAAEEDDSAAVPEETVEESEETAKEPEENAREPEAAAKEPEAERPAQETEEFQSKFQMAQEMGIGEKIKIALTGDKEWRSLLIKDSNKLVSSAVIKNPRVTEAEVLAIAKSTVQNDEIIRIICANKDWVKNALLRKALVENSKTPLPVALRFLSTLSEKDLAMLAKSKNISSVISSQARRTLLNKKNGS